MVEGEFSIIIKILKVQVLQSRSKLGKQTKTGKDPGQLGPVGRNSVPAFRQRWQKYTHSLLK